MKAPDGGAPRDTLRDGGRVYHAAFEQSVHAAWILSADGAILAANRRARGIMAGSDDWHGGPAATAAFPRATAAARGALALALAAATEVPPPRIHVEDVDAAGIGRVHEVTLRPAVAPTGEPLFLILEARDVTEVRRLALEANTARRAAEAGDRAKSTFLARMTHEMRTPLHAVLGFSRLLLRRGSLESAETREAIEQIEAAGDRLLALVNNVLELARLESGGLAIETAPTDVHQLLGGLASRCTETAERRGLRFFYEPDPLLPPSLLVDAGRLARALRDLLDNAVRYTTAGEVRFAAVWEPEGRRDRLALVVADTGPGIPLADQERVLAPFESGRSGNAGTGLGLALARRLVLIMGGTFHLRSGNTGTRIELELPAPRFAVGTVAEEAPAAARALADGAAGVPAGESLAACVALPAPLRSELAEAARIADFDRLKSLVGAITRIDTRLAGAVAATVDRFDYRALLAALAAQPAAASSGGVSTSAGQGEGSGSPLTSPSEASGESGREK